MVWNSKKKKEKKTVLTPDPIRIKYLLNTV